MEVQDETRTQEEGDSEGGDRCPIDPHTAGIQDAEPRVVAPLRTVLAEADVGRDEAVAVVGRDEAAADAERDDRSYSMKKEGNPSSDCNREAVVAVWQ